MIFSMFVRAVWPRTPFAAGGAASAALGNWACRAAWTELGTVKELVPTPPTMVLALVLMRWGGLIPSERQIVAPELRRVQAIALVIEADAAAPEVEGITAVGRPGLQIDPIQERAGADLAVFLELGAALRRYRREPVGRRRRPAEPAPRPVAEEAISRLQAAIEIPLRPFRRRRSDGWRPLLRGEGPGKWDRRNQDRADQQN